MPRVKALQSSGAPTNWTVSSSNRKGVATPPPSERCPDFSSNSLRPQSWVKIAGKSDEQHHSKRLYSDLKGSTNCGQNSIDGMDEDGKYHRL
ncbi:hypothetical protein NPIL_328911 [Nephila pilipes]|uniref:Uncharacterized protein n=1 Tax=Nephila pilipes TaxID=299642 RepID=A0A8X6R041_NEPPI|nr:hypothetical protein NPIL_328911 [Nephila pilipes]